MTFEEQFPQLMGRDQWVFSERLVRVDDVQRHCLAKQRVREAIEKLSANFTGPDEQTIGKEALIKELGL